MSFDFRGFIRRLKPDGTLNIGDPEDKRFYVDFSEVRGDQVVDEIFDGIDIFPEDHTCHLFTGHIGCGKSTELLALRHKLNQEGYFTVYFESTDYLEKADVSIVDVLLAIAICIDRSFTEAKLPPARGLKGIFEKTKEVLNIPIEVNEFAVEAGGIGASVQGDGSFSVGTGFAKITAKAKIDSALREKLNRYLGSIKTELLRDINEELVEPLVNLVREQDKKGLVVIVDNLDRVERGDNRNQHEDLFIGQAEVLQSFPCHMVYTMPLALRFGDRFGLIETRYNPQPKTLPMVRIKTKTGEDNPAGLAKMREMVLVRAFPDLKPEEWDAHITEVFEDPESLNHLCRVSGGHVRNLLQLLSDWALKDWRKDKLTQATLEEKIRQRSNNMILSMDDGEYEMLREVYQTKKIGGDRDYNKLIASRLVFEYQEAQTSWFDLNPIIMGAEKLQDLQA
ncbi:hypothetical protein Lepto7376_1211 [[Leptolyngbya] sp. PCC 7376]|uniref:hypothetical protein n=1 Tax=[Leptolyngbya] sp. PCC 7376 TaxID=111781 RepID=UPI00029EE854|nr:hypothetical protein [[Leptolyngbya] sp. PCC 7376]AFY37568.1 hypothetical protein Lepto7376_1211 [[Leptolyngbya] sp. PCC 7376]